MGRTLTIIVETLGYTFILFLIAMVALEKV